MFKGYEQFFEKTIQMGATRTTDVNKLLSGIKNDILRNEKSVISRVSDEDVRFDLTNDPNDYHQECFHSDFSFSLKTPGKIQTIVIGNKYTSDKDSPGIIMALSDKKIESDAIDIIFPEMIDVSHSKSKGTFVRNVEKISEEKAHVNIKKSRFGHSTTNFEDKYFYATIKYDLGSNKEESSEITWDDVVNLPEFKSLLNETGFELISNSTQKKHMTFLLGIPKYRVIPKNSSTENYPGDYYKEAFALFKSGYLRKIPLNSSPLNRNQAQVMKKFFSGSLEGWKSIIEDLKHHIIGKWKKSLEKRDTKVYFGDDLITHRGEILGRKMNL